MKPVINFVELENRVISVTYRNLMVKAKVVLVSQTGRPTRLPMMISELFRQSQV